MAYNDKILVEHSGFTGRASDWLANTLIFKPTGIPVGSIYLRDLVQSPA